MPISSLERQLQAWRTSTGGATLGELTTKSFLFNKADSKQVDRNQMHQLGLRGLGELAHMDSRFNHFLDDLFSARVLEYTRAMCSPSEAKTIDKAVGDFLILLSPYFLHESAGYALEFLIRFYEIHMWNVDSVMQCILPYHAHKFFPRMVRILSIKKTMWEWLQPLKKSLLPLPREAIVNHCRQDKVMMRLFGRWIETAIDKDVAFSGLITLYTAIVMDALAANDPKKKHFHVELLKLVTPHLLHAYKSDQKDWHAAGLMMTVAMCHRLNLSAEIIKTFVKHLLQELQSVLTRGRSGFRDLLKCIIFVFQSQVQLSDGNLSTELPTDIWRCDWKPYLDDTVSVLDSYECTSFMRYALLSLTRLHLECGDSPEDVNCLSEFLQYVKCSSQHIEEIITECWKRLESEGHQAAETKITKLLGDVEQCFPTQFDMAIVANVKRSREPKRVLDIVTKAAGCGRHSDMLAIVSPIADVRARAMERLDQLAQTSNTHDRMYIQATIAQALVMESEPGVIEAVFQLKCLPEMLHGAAGRLKQVLVRFHRDPKLVGCICGRLLELFNAEVAMQADKKDELLIQYVLLVLPFVLSGGDTSASLSAVKFLAEVCPGRFVGLAQLQAPQDPAERNAAVVQAIAKDAAADVEWLVELVGGCCRISGPSAEPIMHNALVLCLAVLTSAAKISHISADLGQRILKATFISLYEFSALKGKRAVHDPVARGSALKFDSETQDSVARVLGCYCALVHELIKAVPGADYAHMDRSSVTFTVVQQLYISSCQLRCAGCQTLELFEHLFVRVLGSNALPFLAVFWLHPVEHSARLGANEEILAVQAIKDATSRLNQPSVAHALDILPSLLVPLCNQERRVRAAAMKYFQSVAPIAESAPAAEDEKVLHLLYRCDSAFAAQPHAVEAAVCRQLIETITTDANLLKKECANLAWVLTGMADGTQKRAVGKLQKGVVKWVLKHACCWLQHCPHALKVLLQQLQGCKDSALVLTCMEPLLTQYLDQIESPKPPPFTREDGEIAGLAFNLLQAVGAQQQLVDTHWQLFMRSLCLISPMTWEHGVIPALGMYASAKVPIVGERFLFMQGVEVLLNRPSLCDVLSEEQKTALCAALGLLLTNTTTKQVPRVLTKLPELHRVACEKLAVFVKEVKGQQWGEGGQPQKRSRKTLLSECQKFLSTPTSLLEVLNVFHGDDAVVESSVRRRGPGLMESIRSLLRRLFRRTKDMDAQDKYTLSYLTMLALNLQSQLVKAHGAELRMEYDTGELVKIVQKTESHETRAAALRLLVNIGHVDPRQVAQACIQLIRTLAADDNDLTLLKQTLVQLLPIVMREDKEDVDMVGEPQATQETGHLFVAVFYLMRHEFTLEARLSTQEKAEGKIAEAVDLGTFCHGLLAEFTLVEQLTALSRLIPALYPDVDMGAVSKVFQTLEGADAPRTCEHGLRVKVLRFIAGHLQTPGFIEAVEKQIIFVPAAGKGDAGQRSVISDALVETFVTITLSFDFVERLAAKGAPAAEVQDTVDASRSVLRALNYLADLPAFISTLHMLLEHGNPSVRHIALQMLSEKVEQYGPSMTAQDGALFVGLVGHFQTLLRQTLGQEWSTTSYTDQMITVGSVATLSRHLAARYYTEAQVEGLMELLCDVLQQHLALAHQTGPYQVDMERQSVVGSCATALVVICKEVGPQEDKVHAVIQRLPHYYAALLKYLGASLSYVDLGSQSAKAENVLNYHFELLGSLHGITSVCFAAGLQAMLGRYVEELMRCVTHKHLLESPHPPVVDEARRLVLLLGDDMPWAQLQDALLNTLESTEYETHDHQVVLKSLEKALYSLEKAPPANFPEKLLGSTLKHFLAYFDALTSPFLAPHELCDSTASMVFAAVRLVRENEFRLFFEEVVTWCWEIGKATPAKIQLFYLVAGHIGVNLKEVFVRYFTGILDHTCGVLSNKKGRYNAVVPVLMQFMDRFFNAVKAMKMTHEHWRSLVVGVVEQVNNQEYMHTETDGKKGHAVVQGCVLRMCQLAGAVLWRDVQKQLTMLFTSDDNAVRMDALRIIKHLYVKLTHDFAVACMPEFLPRLYELLEHEDEDLQQLATETKLAIERVTGESMDQYF